jgi:V/A-type H+/Na+-transporting ATPase subunit D
MADDILEGVSPTRMELLRIKDRLRLAEKGHKLLKEKRDTMVMEFMSLARQAGEIGENAARHMETARTQYKKAVVACGKSHIISAAAASSETADVEIEYRNVLGIKLPRMRFENASRSPDERNVSLITTHPTIDVVSFEYEQALQDLIQLTQTEYSLLSLSAEVKKTKRRVNALEYKVIPSLKNTGKYLTMRLDEMEREGFYRNKLIKKKGQK